MTVEIVTIGDALSDAATALALAQAKAAADKAAADLAKLGAVDRAKVLADAAARRAQGSLQLWPGNHLETNEVLVPNRRLRSMPNQKAYAILQDDGNFVLYRTDNGQALWATGTQGKGIKSARLQTDGNLVFFGDPDGNASGHSAPIWATMSNGYPNCKLVVQDDMNMAIYSGDPPNWKAVWNSETWGGVNRHQDHAFLAEISNDVFAPVADAATSIVSRIPGADFVGEQLQDFAKTSVGKTFFRAISSAIVPVLFTVNPGMGMVVSTLVGTALGTAAFIMPGLLRGEPVDQAFLDELKSYVSKVSPDLADKIKTFGVDAIPDPIKDQFAKTGAALDNWATQHGLDFDKLATQGIDIRTQVAKGIDPKVIAGELAPYGVTPELVQKMIDGATRTVNAGGLQFDERGYPITVTPKAVSFEIFAPGLLAAAARKPAPVVNTARTTRAVLSPAPAPIVKVAPAAFLTPTAAKTTPAFTPIDMATMSAATSSKTAQGLYGSGLDALRFARAKASSGPSSGGPVG